MTAPRAVTLLLVLALAQLMAACAPPHKVEAPSAEEVDHAYTELPAEAPPPLEVPSFPWPPPQWSASCDLPRHVFDVPGRETRCGDVADRLEGALHGCGYVQLAYYSAPGGFAVASEFEQINDDGTPKGGDDRWSHGIARASGSFGNYLRSLFTAVTGHYRVVVFVVIDESIPRNGPAVSEADADAWMHNGLDRLPEAPRQRALTPAHRIVALIYEFRRPDSDKPAIETNPSNLTAEVHLQRARLWHELGY
jgi:hypothetical protein